MNELKLVVENGRLVADSREVAEMIGKRHDHLVRDIDGYAEVISENSKLSSQSNTPNLGASDFFIEEIDFCSKMSELWGLQNYTTSRSLSG